MKSFCIIGLGRFGRALAETKSDKSYEIIIIDSDPDGNIYEKIPAHFPMCRFNREYTADDLNHYVFTIFY